MARRVEGSVLQRRCDRCGADHFDFEFSGDTDMATEGLVAATSPGYAVVGLREADAGEWAALVRDDPVPAEAGFQRTFGGPGWRLPRLLRWESSASVHRCLACPEGECRVVDRVDAADFERSGGRILIDDGLVLQV